jgi:hypothetical protein
MERTIQASPYKHPKIHLALLHCAKRHPPTSQFGGYYRCNLPTTCLQRPNGSKCTQPTSPEYGFHVAKPTPDTHGRHMLAYRCLARLYPKWPGSSNLGAVFVDYGTPEVEDSWIGRLWKWMSVTNLRIKLKGREAIDTVRCRDRVGCTVASSRCYMDKVVLKGMGGCTWVCQVWSGYTVSDLFRRDGKSLRYEMHVSGEWTGIL